MIGEPRTNRLLIREFPVARPAIIHPIGVGGPYTFVDSIWLYPTDNAEQQKRQIELCDAVWIFDETQTAQIDYANKLKKNIRYERIRVREWPEPFNES